MYLRKKNRTNKQEPQIIEGCFLGGLFGGCSSAATTVKQVNNQTVIDNNTFNSSSEIVNSIVSETLLSAANNCTAANYSSQVQNFKDLFAGYDATIGGTQSTRAALSFNCVQSSVIANTSETALMAEMMTGLINKSSTEALQKMDALAESKNKMGALSMGQSQSSSNIDQINNFTKQFNANTNIATAVANSIVNNVKEESVQNCIASVSSSQVLNAENIHAGHDIVTMFDQTIGSELTSKCMQSSKMGNSVMNSITNLLGITVENEDTTKTNQGSKGDGSSDNKQEGLGDVIDSVFGDLANIVGGWMTMYEMMIGALVCCCCLCVVSCFFMFSGKS